MASILTAREKKLLLNITYGEGHVWRDYSTYEIQKEKTAASKWCMDAIEAEKKDYEAVKSLHAKKLIYWHAGETAEYGPHYHLTPKGLKAMIKAGLLHLCH